MIQKWEKLGLIYVYNKNKQNNNYSTVPFAEKRNGNIFRIYFSPRDELNRSFVSFFDYDIVDKKIVFESQHPILYPGKLGSFDDSGVVCFQIINYQNKKYLFYSGWQLGVTVPFYFWIGLAISEDGTTFHKISPSPILPISSSDPYMTGAPYVIIENGKWKMWYISGTEWVLETNKPKHYYTIKYAESLNGIDWTRFDNICISYNHPYEYAIARPFVLKENEIYKMWYSYRGSKKAATYRIGYAESINGIDWQRKDDEAGISTSEEGWDSDMICYSFIFDHNNKRYMLYNGNGYGKTGIGLAVLEKG